MCIFELKYGGTSRYCRKLIISIDETVKIIDQLNDLMKKKNVHPYCEVKISETSVRKVKLLFVPSTNLVNPSSAMIGIWLRGDDDTFKSEANYIFSLYNDYEIVHLINLKDSINKIYREMQIFNDIVQSIYQLLFEHCKEYIIKNPNIDLDRTFEVVTGNGLSELLNKQNNINISDVPYDILSYIKQKCSENFKEYFIKGNGLDLGETHSTKQSFKKN